MSSICVRAPQLVTCAPGHRPRGGRSMAEVGLHAPGVLVVRDGRVEYAGPDPLPPHINLDGVPRLDLQHGVIVPGLVDAHTHPVYAGSRVEEFQMRARGATYLEIHQAGGGIASTVRATRTASGEELERRTRRALTWMLKHGTTTAECKSGYGLSAATELEHLRLLQRIQASHPIDIVPTYLGAHAIPAGVAREDYVDEVVQTLGRVDGLARFCDVFCDEGAFTLAEARRILEAARAHRLGLRIHAEEFAYYGSARMAAELGAASCDHLLQLPPEDFPMLREQGTVATVMPGTAFFLGKAQYAPARGLMDADVAVAVATDFNAGSCLTPSLAMAMSLAVLRTGMTPEEALVAATVNGAWAVGRGEQVGSLEPGKQADFLILDVDDYRQWPYHFGANVVRRVFKGGKSVEGQDD